MRRLIRSFAVVAAVAALSVPVFGATRHASACSQPGGPTTIGNPLLGNQICFFNVGPGGTAETYISPITGTFGTAAFAEIPTSAETTTAPTADGSLSFAIYDFKGTNSGFTAYLSCTSDPCLSNKYEAPYGIPAANISVTGKTMGLVYPFLGVGVGPGIGLDNPGPLSMLDISDPRTGTAVGGECAVPSIGQAAYLFDVPLSLNLSNPMIPGGGHYNTLPVKFFGSFTVSVVEDMSPDGCPAYVPASALPVAAPGGGPITYPLL